MKKGLIVFLLAVAVIFAAPASSWAGAVDRGQTGQSDQVGQGDSGQAGDEGQEGEVGQGDSDQAGQTGQTGQTGKPKWCLWKQIWKLFSKDPKKEHEKMLKLLSLAKKDLDLCLETIGGKKKSYLKVFPAIEHLNHAMKAIKKINYPKHLKPAFHGLYKRISHAKFYLVTNNFDEAEGRINKALEYIGELDGDE